MHPDFDTACLSTLKDFFSQPENWAARHFSLSKNSFVLSDSMSLRLVLFKGPVSFSGKLKNIGPLQLRLLRGELQIQKLGFKTDTTNNGTARSYNVTHAIEQQQVTVEQPLTIDHWTAIDFVASEDAVWLIQFTKSPQYTTCVSFDAANGKPERVSLLYHCHSRLFNYIEVLARSTCERSQQALLKLSESPLDELAWRAIEGLNQRAPVLADIQLRKFAITHPSEIVKNRSRTLVSQARE